MRLIGLTGGIATGKSTVAAMLTAHGATLIDADELARTAVRPGERTLARVAERFGDGVLLADGSLNRERLGDIVFADAAARRDLERITHPRILELMQDGVAAALARDAPAVVVDIPLLFESGREEMFEGVLLVYTTPEIQLHRLRERDSLDESSARQRVAAQLPIEEKRARATWIIDNGGSLAQTQRQVHAWWDDTIGE